MCVRYEYDIWIRVYNIQTYTNMYDVRAHTISSRLDRCISHVLCCVLTFILFFSSIGLLWMTFPVSSAQSSYFDSSFLVLVFKNVCEMRWRMAVMRKCIRLTCNGCSNYGYYALEVFGVKFHHGFWLRVLCQRIYHSTGSENCDFETGCCESNEKVANLVKISIKGVKKIEK